MGSTVFGMGAHAAKTSKRYWLPEESGPHERTFMQWPVSRDVHPDPVFLGALQRTIADVANTIAEFEPVVMLMDGRYRLSAERRLGGHVEIWDIPTDDLWCRDSGPLFVINETREIAVARIRFNGWGNKQAHVNDGRIAERVAERLGIPVIDAGVIGEAGGVEADGEGTLIAHESSWVNDNRNWKPRDTIERRLLQALGAEKMVWAPGIKGADITDYHIDALARFTRPGQVIIQLPERPDDRDPWSISAFQTLEVLRGATDAKGRSFDIVELPEPYETRVTSSDFVASYVNYYACNRAIIAAQFGDREADAQARATLQTLYPEREIVTLNVDPIGETGGGIHCATQQQPST